MKALGRIYGEAKINVREMMGNRENTTEPPSIKRQTKNIEDIKQYLKEISTRMSKQSKTNLLSIEENELVGNAFDEYGQKLKEDGDFGPLGDLFGSLASFHQSIEALRLQMDTSLQTKLSTPFSDFVHNEVRHARNEKLKYDKARVTFDALYNKAKQLKKKGSIDKVVEAERELEEYKLTFEEIALETVKVQSDVCEMHAFQTLERLCDYIAIYEDFFTQGLSLAKQISKDLPSYRASIKEAREDFKIKKVQRGDADEEPGSNMVFGVPLEDLVNRENTGTDVPILVDHCIKYLYKNSLKVEGIFRVSGSQREVQELKKAVGRGNIDFSQVLNDHNVSGVLKLFLRELPAPLFPFNLYNPIIKCVQEAGKDDAACTREMKALLDTLPSMNKVIIRYIFGLMHQIAANSSENLMTPRNLAVVLAPNILYSRDVSLEAVADSNGAIEFLVSHYEQLFNGSFVDLMNSIPTHNPEPKPESKSGSSLSISSPNLPSTPSKSVAASPAAQTGVRLPVSTSPVHGGGAPLFVQSPNKPNPAVSKRPVTMYAPSRGSSMFQLGQLGQENDDFGLLRKTTNDESAGSLVDEPVVVGAAPIGPTSTAPSPRGTIPPHFFKQTSPNHPPPHLTTPPVHHTPSAAHSHSHTHHTPTSHHSTTHHTPSAHTPTHHVNHHSPTHHTPAHTPTHHTNHHSPTHHTPTHHTPSHSHAHSSTTPTQPPRAMPDPVRKNSLVQPSTKQLPPRPTPKVPAGSPTLNSSGSAYMPPPPANLPPPPSNQLPPPPTNLPPPPAIYHGSVGNIPPTKTTSSPSLSYLHPPPPLQTPPLKQSASRNQNEDLIQF